MAGCHTRQLNQPLSGSVCPPIFLLNVFCAAHHGYFTYVMSWYQRWVGRTVPLKWHCNYIIKQCWQECPMTGVHSHKHIAGQQQNMTSESNVTDCHRHATEVLKYRGRTWLEHRSNFGRTPFLQPPVTHIGTSGSWTQVRWMQVCRLINRWATAAPLLSTVATAATILNIYTTVTVQLSEGSFVRNV